MTVLDYENLEPGQWREVKRTWFTGASKFYRVQPSGQQQRLTGSAQSYLNRVNDRMGFRGKGYSIGKQPRGVFREARLRTAEALEIGGSEQTKKNWVSKARRELVEHGFLEEKRRGTGGNGHKNVASELVMSFRFLELHGTQVGTDSPGKGSHSQGNANDMPFEEQATQGNAKSMPFGEPTTQGNAKSMPGQGNANDVRDQGNANIMPFIERRASEGEVREGNYVSGSDSAPGFRGGDFVGRPGSRPVDVVPWPGDGPSSNAPVDGDGFANYSAEDWKTMGVWSDS